MLSSILGISEALIAAIAFSTASLFIKVSLRDLRNPFLINGIRALSASFIYLITFLYLGFECPSLYALLLIITSSLIGPGLGDILFILSVDRLGAGFATLLSYQYILISQILNAVILRDMRGFQAIYLTPIALLGLYILVSDKKLTFDRRGIMLAYNAAIAWSISTIMISYLVNFMGESPITVAGLRVFFLTPLLLGLGVNEVVKVTRRALTVLVISGFTSYFVGFVTFTLALKELGVMVPSLITALTPMLSQIMSVKLLKERITGRGVIGSALIILSLIFAIILTS